MGVKVRKRHGKWYVFIDYHGRRKAKCIGPSRAAAEQVKHVLEAKLALGDLGVLAEGEDKPPTFGEYARRWQKEYADVHCKPSTARKHEEVLRLHLLPVFERIRLSEITRDRLKQLIAQLVTKPKISRKRAAEGEPEATVETLSRNSIRLILSTLRVILSQAVEDGIIAANPAARIGRFVKVDKERFRPSPLGREEAESFLKAAREICPAYYTLFLTALRAGLRRGELVALTWGDIQFGQDEADSNRYILVQRNYVHGQFTTTKSKKYRRVDLSKQLRTELLHLRDQRLLEAFQQGKSSIMEDLVFPAPEGGILHPDNLYHRYFLPCLEHASLRRIRFHDLRHTFGSLLIQGGVSLAYVKDQMGHSSIQVTVDIYGHLLPGANVSYVDRLDSETNPQESATPAQQTTPDEADNPKSLPREVVEMMGGNLGGGGRTRTFDLRIMRPSL
jgi:integrase